MLSKWRLVGSIVFILLVITAIALWLPWPFPSADESLTASTEYDDLPENTPFVPGRQGGTLTLDIVGQGLSSVNPIVEQQEDLGQIFRLLHAGLVEQNVTTAEIKPALATHWEISEEVEYLFTLRRGVRWSDGEPFTADDVLFTFRDVMFNADIFSPLRKLFVIDGQLPIVEMLDENTIRFVTPTVYAPFLRWLSLVPILPEHRLSQHVARLHPPGAKQTVGKAHVIVQSIFRNQASAYVGDDHYQALETGLTQLTEAVNEREITRMTETLLFLEATLNTIENTMPQLERAEVSEGDLYPLSLLGLAIVNLRNVFSNISLQARRGNFDALGLREDTFAQAWSGATPNEAIVGLGPFQIESFSKAQITLSRNPYYWKRDSQLTTLPYLDVLHIRFVQDREQALANFALSQTQILFPNPQDLTLLKGKTGVMKNDGDYELQWDTPTFGANFVVLNQDDRNRTRRKIFGNAKFRKALSLAIDRKRLIEETLHGAGVILDGPIHPSSMFHSQGLPVQAFDLDRAATLLDEAGYRDLNGDGLREDETGDSLRFSIITNKDNPLRVRTAQMLQANLGELGIEVSLELVGFNNLTQKVFSGAYQVAVLGLTGGIDPHGGINMWRLGGTLRFWRLQSAPLPWEQRVDFVFREAAATLAFERRKKLYDEFQRVVAEQLPIIYTVAPLRLLAYDKTLGNIAVSNALSAPLRLVEFLFFK